MRIFVTLIYIYIIDKNFNQSTTVCSLARSQLVYVIERDGVKFWINFTGCSENDNFAVIATTRNLSQISLLPVLSQITTIASFVKVNILVFKLASMMNSGFLLLF